MKRLLAAMAPRWQRLLEFAAWGALIVAIFTSTRFLFALVGRGIGWIIGLLPRPEELWKECPRCL